ncbi:MAG: hypothetical protein IJ134_02160 [Bacilli bacterium]|nr:hypothetical protein [Bacilli bacterium]
MKVAKDMAFMMIGAGAVLAYQKYKEPVKNVVDKAMKKEIKKADKMLEDMM